MSNTSTYDRRLPAEWEPQSFLQLTFPHANSDWEYLLQEASKCFVNIIEAAARFQPVLVVCDSVTRVKSYFSDCTNIYFTEIPSNDTWARDHGGITVLTDGGAVVQDYIFNGWGKKFEAGLDNQITKNLFEQNLIQNSVLESFDFVLEGGSIESDGKGTILTTTECLMEKNRNPQLSKAGIEAILKQNLGAKKVLWLDHGYLAGDDTDSHIDTLARFCNENTIAYVGCNNPDDEHYNALQQMKEQLQQFTNAERKPYDLVELPFPDACFDSEGNRLPATYANFTVINDAVLVPVYELPQDQIAVDIFAKIFPEREIIPVNCRVLIEQHGSLHCVTMQYPKAVVFNCKK
ncbi:agmatine deiminase family protein [Maribellus sp. CM-23]|uniref:agmatine deiminase family protein n=1 Tax=Maribellus sp. CM-23 TaxID=2781026 RepID=UPI001F36642D|nr:agmatine deiminase family protein [Maribellus sp. CM-23]MCE4562734.1 agmatine deiminase family protein [Maribellus sp. CM-23]